MFDLETFQQEQKEWAARNFPEVEAYQSLLGIFEEIGELSHAHLKEEQEIRGSKDEHRAAKKDAIGDAIVYMAQYCTAHGWSLAEIIYETWQKTKRGLRPET